MQFVDIKPIAGSRVMDKQNDSGIRLPRVEPGSII